MTAVNMQQENKIESEDKKMTKTIGKKIMSKWTDSDVFWSKWEWELADNVWLISECWEIVVGECV